MRSSRANLLSNKSAEIFEVQTAKTTIQRNCIFGPFEKDIVAEARTSKLNPKPRMLRLNTDNCLQDERFGWIVDLSVLVQATKVNINISQQCEPIDLETSE